MRLLLDECVPRRLRRDLIGHSVTTLEEAGFKGLENGILLAAASERFDVLLTVDKNIEYQQNTGSLPIPVLILSVRDIRYQSLKLIVPAALESLKKIDKPEIVKVEG